ncbi:macro domain-containing protein RSc0334-like [Neocloeon triangulifer]|uniref:macro domain-containing protein RSc0334-like n=1 Tax=Neocloeon triangulifer TaxID=2078957 RepID=UPI00286EFD71|nr:macro domain-containing protein RSc0334-like [Neocloeon triangulifer]
MLTTRRKERPVGPRSGGTCQKLSIKYLSMPLEEKRKFYRKDHFTLDQVLTWQEFAATEELTPPKDPPQAKFDEELNRKVSIFEGDITTLEIDIVVNAANKYLGRGAGVCGAIFAGAGDILEEECDSMDGCPPGDAKLTGGYKLPAKYILHAVGPIDKNPDVLKSCYKNCLGYLKQPDDDVEPSLRTIAFPCIGTGIYGFPNNKAAEIAVSLARSFLEKNRDHVDRIIFCLFDSIDKKLYRKYMQLYFPTE